MRFRSLAVFALAVVAPLLATAADPKKDADSLEGTWVPSAAAHTFSRVPDAVAMKRPSGENASLAHPNTIGCDAHQRRSRVCASRSSTRSPWANRAR